MKKKDIKTDSTSTIDWSSMPTQEKCPTCGRCPTCGQSTQPYQGGPPYFSWSTTDIVI